ncbi:hypothetical protein DDE18_07390 [Nocardioides gansuensis]|uniref:Serine protease n=1 Tax=Nocardioides gansuensis TaxID=2138300 RepID=A0A2T8FBQ0_9ACTN|nr:hypothetical protein [Nocardioides gansuensis]PVG83137.1 hypothetical protein DDE18_07390 [Nocardioides gansuensis]
MLCQGRPVRSLLSLLGTLLLGAATAASPAGAAEVSSAQVRGPRWAPAARATITPGVQMMTAGAQCTANFVFTDTRHRVYVGYAAHCAGLGEATETDGCETGSLPLGTRVDFVRGASLLEDGTALGRGRLVYSSWLAMQELGVEDPDACAANDFALVRVSRADRRKVNPSVPVFGGPVGLAEPPAQGEAVLSYGQSRLRPGTVLSPRRGVSLGPSYGGWGSDAYTLAPGVPGDSGSGFLDAQGRAFGTLSTLALTPLPAANGLGSLARELAFARQHSGLRKLRLVRGTEPFTG